MRTGTLRAVIAGTALALGLYASVGRAAARGAEPKAQPGPIAPAAAPAQRSDGVWTATTGGRQAAPPPAQKKLREEREMNVEKPLPDFALRDLSGRTWRSANLKGKITVINVWAST